MIRLIIGGLSLGLSGIAALIANTVRSDTKSQVTAHVLDKAESVDIGNPIGFVACVCVFAYIIYAIHK